VHLVCFAFGHLSVSYFTSTGIWVNARFTDCRQEIEVGRRLFNVGHYRAVVYDLVTRQAAFLWCPTTLTMFRSRFKVVAVQAEPTQVVWVKEQDLVTAVVFNVVGDH
jgi:hypothetical protein